MAKLLNEVDLRNKALAVLEERLGAVDALRFVALIRREPFDYEAWRDKSFANLAVADLFETMERLENHAD